MESSRESSLPPFLRRKRDFEARQREELVEEAAALARLTASERLRLLFDLIEFEDRLLEANPRDLEALLAREREQKFESFRRARRLARDPW